MNELTLHPRVYATGQSKGLIGLLERVWVREPSSGDGTLFIMSGFANYNGGVRFYEVFRNHVNLGGHVVAVLSGSTSARLTSRQVVHQLLECGATVYLVNRKRMLHAKCYGASGKNGEAIVVSSGNFTGPGMSQNVEMSVALTADTTYGMNFSWTSMLESILAQNWNIYQPRLENVADPAWQLLYDEQAATVTLDETDEVTMLLRLGHADTVRINAIPGSDASKGTQYFWLSKDCYDFFPPLTLRNMRGHKATYSCIVTMQYMDLDIVDESCRVTFEAENNLDFRLGTGQLRNTDVASEGDLAAITRVGENDYQMRLYRQGSKEYNALIPYAVNFIGNRRKVYGYIANTDFWNTVE